jgi:hypothetical protein
MQRNDRGIRPGPGAPKGNQNAIGNRGGSGRPSRYSPDLIPVVKLMAIGATSDQEIAGAIRISIETLRRWRRERIEFLNGTRVTNDEMAAAARMSLYRRAVGFTYKREKVLVSGGKVIRVPTIEHVIPDVSAAIKILQAYDTEDVWREKRDVKTDNPFSLADLVAISMKQRRAEAEGKLIDGDLKKVER